MKKLSIFIAFTVGITLLFVSGALYPSEAQVIYGCYKGNNFRIVSDPSECKQGETSTTLLTASSSPLQLPKIYVKECGHAFGGDTFQCLCEPGDVLITGGAMCAGIDEFLIESFPLQGYIPALDIYAAPGWQAMCKSLTDMGTAHEPHYFVIQCVVVD